MGRRDTAALSQLNGRGQIKKEWVVGGEGEEEEGRKGERALLSLFPPPPYSRSLQSPANVLESCSYNVPTLS